MCVAGVTQRRWLAFCNPPLRQLITKKLGNDDWILHLDNLRELRKYANDPEFQVRAVITCVWVFFGGGSNFEPIP